MIVTPSVAPIWRENCVSAVAEPISTAARRSGPRGRRPASSTRPRRRRSPCRAPPRRRRVHAHAPEQEHPRRQHDRAEHRVPAVAAGARDELPREEEVMTAPSVIGVSTTPDESPRCRSRPARTAGRRRSSRTSPSRRAPCRRRCRRRSGCAAGRTGGSAPRLGARRARKREQRGGDERADHLRARPRVLAAAPDETEQERPSPRRARPRRASRSSAARAALAEASSARSRRARPRRRAG